MAEVSQTAERAPGADRILHMLRAALTIALISMPLTHGASLWAQDEEPLPPEDIERVIEEILQLRGEAEALLEGLPPELREEVERRWQELKAAPRETPTEEAPLPAAPAEAVPEPQAGPDQSAPVPAKAPAAPEPTPELEPEPEDKPTAPSGTESRPTPAPVPESEPEPAPVPAKECDSLGPFDSNADGVISAGDRNWRYFRLQTGVTGNPAKSGHLESLYDLDIREVDVNLRFYKLGDGLSGDITVDDRIRFHLFAKRKSDRGSATLFLQASRLARSGDLKLVDSAGVLLAGDQPLAPGTALETAEGKRLPILCP